LKTEESSKIAKIIKECSEAFEKIDSSQNIAKIIKELDKNVQNMYSQIYAIKDPRSANLLNNPRDSRCC
jgi:hypothetical protein